MRHSEGNMGTTATEEASLVAKLISDAIDKSGKSNTQIARETGFPRPNVIAMIRYGDTKLPLERVPGMARALGLDAKYLMRTTLAEYMPWFLPIVEDLFGAAASRNELEILRTIREATGNADPHIGSDRQREQLMEWARSLPY